MSDMTGYIEQLGTPETLEQAIAERNAWIESAAQFSRNEDYYRGLVQRIGRALGDNAYIADDGSRSEDVLCAKVPELVEQLVRTASGEDGLAWAVAKWKSEVENRPLVNINRRPLDDAWRQMVRYFGGDDEALLGPRHDDLLAAAVPPEELRRTASAPPASEEVGALREAVAFYSTIPAGDYPGKTYAERAGTGQCFIAALDAALAALSRPADAGLRKAAKALLNRSAHFMSGALRVSGTPEWRNLRAALAAQEPQP